LCKCFQLAVVSIYRPSSTEVKSYLAELNKVFTNAVTVSD